MSVHHGGTQARMTRDVRPPRVAVVYAGPSEEREVSLQSGEAVAGALESEGYPVWRLIIDESVGPFLDELREDVDVVFLALHGRYGEDGTVQAALEAAGVTYTGSGPAASRDAMHKPTSKRLFEAAGVPTPKYYVAGHDSDAGRGSGLRSALQERGIAPPLVVKPAASGSSIGVTIVRDEAELGPALDEARALGREVLVEEFVDGRELTVGVLAGAPPDGRGNRALPVVELVPARDFYDYEAKYADEATRIVCPAELGDDERRRVQGVGLAAFEAVGARDFARTDVILGADGVPRALEVNTIPGFTSHSLLPRAAAAAGISFGGLAGRIVELAAERERLHRRGRGGRRGD